MFGINGFELVILVIVALLVIGPKRLPEYAAKLREFVKGFRRMAEGAKDSVKKDFGPVLEEYDWQQLDPRQYDPRRIVREALHEEDAAIREEKLRARSGARTATDSANRTSDEVSTDSAPGSGGGAVTSPLERHKSQLARRRAGEGAPFDTEAT